MRQEKVFAIRFASLYPMYLRKVEAKGRSRAELDAVLCWMTGHDQPGLQAELDSEHDLEAFFAQAPAFNPRADQVKGVVCGVRVEEIDHPLMRRIRIMDRLVDELARGKALDKILRR